MKFKTATIFTLIIMSSQVMASTKSILLPSDVSTTIYHSFKGDNKFSSGFFKCNQEFVSPDSEDFKYECSISRSKNQDGELESASIDAKRSQWLFRVLSSDIGNQDVEAKMEYTMGTLIEGKVSCESYSRCFIEIDTTVRDYMYGSLEIHNSGRRDLGIGSSGKSYVSTSSGVVRR